MGPAFDVGVGAEELADVAGELRHPEELDVMSGIGLVDAGADDGAYVEGCHVFGDVGLRPVVFRQRHVEVGDGGVGLEGAGRVHGGLRGGAHEGRRLLQGGLDCAGDGDDVVCIDEGDEAGEGVLEGAEELVGARDGWWRVRRGLPLGCLGGIDLFGYALELGLIAVEIVKADLE